MGGSPGAAILPAPGEPRGIATGDVDGNGTADLIYSTYEGGAIRTLLGDGAGSFTSGPGDAGAASHPQGLSVGDFNRDGRLDIAVATVSATGLRVLYGLGGARFTARAVTGASSLNVAAAADLNGDGWLDIAAASTATARMVIYLGGPTGLTRSATYTTGASPRGLAIADVNGDGWLDVTTADRQASSVSVFRADRAHPGFFLARVTVSAGLGSRSVTAADFNGDGRLDLATGNQYAASVTVLMNTTALARAGFGFSPVEVGTPLHQWGTDDVWPADFNRDGRLDFAVIADNQMRVAVLLTNGATVTLPTQGIDRFAVADVNGDGTEDVVAVVGAVNVLTYLGDGRGGFIASSVTALPDAAVAWSVGDADADGTPDLAILGGFGNGPVWLMHGNGDGTFALAVTAARWRLGPEPHDGRHQPRWAARRRSAPVGRTRRDPVGRPCWRALARTRDPLLHRPTRLHRQPVADCVGGSEPGRLRGHPRVGPDEYPGPAHAHRHRARWPGGPCRADLP